jgi:hypothetical protein
MCMVIYIGSRSPLPLIPWSQDAPAFNVTVLTEHALPVWRHFAASHVCQAGSHTGCGCGFNEGREHPEVYDNPATERADALRSSSQLAEYVRENQVEQIYSCWSGDEGESKEFERRITPEALVAEDFFFRERELLVIEHSAAVSNRRRVRLAL